MEDENKIKKIMKIILIVIILIAIGAIGIFIYNKYQTQANTNKFNNYLKNNNYQKNDEGIYYKTNTNNKITTTDKAGSKEYIFARTTSEEGTNYITTTIEYKKDESIDITYQIEGYAPNGNYGILFQEGTYTKEKFDCKIVTNVGFDTECDTMKKQAKDYEKEIENILNQNKINTKYIKINNKNETQV